MGRASRAAVKPDRAPAASLSEITIRTKNSAARKRGDLTQLFQHAETHLPPPRPAAQVVVAEPPPPPPVVETVAEPVNEPEVTLAPIPFADEPEPWVPPTAPNFDIEPVEPEETIPSTIEHAAAMFESEPQEPAALEPEPLPPAPPPVEFTPAPLGLPRPTFADITGYWRHLRVGEPYPGVEAVDRDLVSERWPGSLLIAFARNPQDPQADPSLSRVTRLGVTNADAENAVDYAPYATEWMLDLGRAALDTGEPIEELQRLPTRNGASGFRLVALPLGPKNRNPEAVLCQLSPDKSAPRFGKKRKWLED